MARDLMDDTYYTSQGGSKIPVKWTAPEVFFWFYLLCELSNFLPQLQFEAPGPFPHS